MVTLCISPSGYNGAGGVNIVCDASASPSTYIGSVIASGLNYTWGSTVSYTFIVLPGYYYAATAFSLGALAYWTEWV